MAKSKVKKVKAKDTIVGKKQYTNEETGKLEELNLISKNEDTDINFHKVWVDDLSIVLSKIGNSKIKILAHIFENMDSKNTYIASIRDMATKLNVGQETVRRTLNELKETKLLRMVKAGVYQVSPDLIFKGKTKSRQIVRNDYYGIKNEKTKLAKSSEDYKEQEYLRKQKLKEDKIIEDNMLKQYTEDLENSF